jgi:hypothetical protein
MGQHSFGRLDPDLHSIGRLDLDPEDLRGRKKRR